MKTKPAAKIPAKETNPPKVVEMEQGYTYQKPPEKLPPTPKPVVPPRRDTSKKP